MAREKKKITIFDTCEINVFFLERDLLSFVRIGGVNAR